MKHFLPVNAGDTERVLELIYVSKGQASHAALSNWGFILCLGLGLGS